MATVWTSNASVTHPKKPGSAPAVQFSPSQKTVTGLKSTWGKERKKQPNLGRGELVVRSLQKPGSGLQTTY